MNPRKLEFVVIAFSDFVSAIADTSMAAVEFGVDPAITKTLLSTSTIAGGRFVTELLLTSSISNPSESVVVRYLSVAPFGAGEGVSAGEAGEGETGVLAGAGEAGEGETGVLAGAGEAGEGEIGVLAGAGVGVAGAEEDPEILFVKSITTSTLIPVSTTVSDVSDCKSLVFSIISAVLSAAFMFSYIPIPS